MPPLPVIPLLAPVQAREGAVRTLLIRQVAAIRAVLPRVPGVVVAVRAVVDAGARCTLVRSDCPRGRHERSAAERGDQHESAESVSHHRVGLLSRYLQQAQGPRHHAPGETLDFWWLGYLSEPEWGQHHWNSSFWHPIHADGGQECCSRDVPSSSRRS